MIKKSIYPKTQRIKDGRRVKITEKLDGSNLSFFKKDGVIHIATRNNILNTKEDLKSCSNILYKGLKGWLYDNLSDLEDSLYEGSVVSGEWLGMGKIKYPEHFDKKFYMFAKGRIDEEFNMTRIAYNHDDFKYCFEKQEIPHFIGVVPVVYEGCYLPEVSFLDELYQSYVKLEDRDVEGFVVEFNDSITKYVRMKNGKLEPHKS